MLEDNYSKDNNLGGKDSYKNENKANTNILR